MTPAPIQNSAQSAISRRRFSNRSPRLIGGLAQVAEVDGTAAPHRGEIQPSSGAVDHGYATTIHKAQGITVDWAFVVGSGSMDRHMAYVALTRHRDGVQLYAGREEFKDFAALSSRLSRGGVKETTLDYARRRGLEAEGRAPARDGARTTAERPLQRPAAAVERGSGPEERETPAQEPAGPPRSWLGRLVARVRGAEPARQEAEPERLPSSQLAPEPIGESPMRAEERNRLLGRPEPT